MKRTFRDYQEKLLQDLQDSELAAAYLNVALMDEDPRVFLLALKNVYEAQGGDMTPLATLKNHQISRSHLSSPNRSSIFV
jgi:DNA-binding phage protein